MSEKVKCLQLKNELKEKISPIYVIFGSDCYLRKHAFGELKNICEIANDFDVNEATSIIDFISGLNVFPFMSKRRLCYLSIKEITSDVKKALIGYLASPNLGALGIISVDGGELPQELDLTYVDCQIESLSVITNWITAYFRMRRGTISKELAEHIASSCNRDMSKVANTVGLISDYLGDGSEVTLSKVEIFIPKDYDVEVFDLVNAIARRDADNALRLLYRLDAKRGDETKLLALIYNNFQRIFYASVSNLSDGELAKLLNVKEYAITKAKELAKRYTPVRIKQILNVIEKTETDLKLGKISVDDALKRTILRIV